jgi:hypothetical protein
MKSGCPGRYCSKSRYLIVSWSPSSYTTRYLSVLIEYSWTVSLKGLCPGKYLVTLLPIIMLRSIRNVSSVSYRGEGLVGLVATGLGVRGRKV